MDDRDGSGVRGGQGDNVERKVSKEQVEGLISRLPSVVSCHLVVNDWGGLDEVHVLTTRERSPKQVVRDVESCLAAQWGISVDHKKISVAQVADEASLVKPVRLILDSYSINRDLVQNQVLVGVTLSCPQDRVSFTGKAQGPAQGSQKYRVLARATLEALNGAISQGYHLGLESVRIQEAGAYSVVITVVTLTGSDGSQEPLAGASVLEEEGSASVVKACLAALNRRLGRLYQPGRGEPWGSKEDK